MFHHWVQQIPNALISPKIEKLNESKKQDSTNSMYEKYKLDYYKGWSWKIYVKVKKQNKTAIFQVLVPKRHNWNIKRRKRQSQDPDGLNYQS